MNRVKPLKPGSMMGAQRYIILGSFVIAAILTPTPDPINQTIMALPAVVLYQVSIVLIWWVNKNRKVMNQLVLVDIPKEVMTEPLAAPLVMDTTVTSKPVTNIPPKLSAAKPVSDFIVQRPIVARPRIVRQAPIRPIGRYMDVVLS